MKQMEVFPLAKNPIKMMKLNNYLILLRKQNNRVRIRCDTQKRLIRVWAIVGINIIIPMGASSPRFRIAFGIFEPMMVILTYFRD